MTTNPQAPTPATGSLSFDGIGINGPDEYRTRLATFSSHDAAKQYGPLLAAAPGLLAALRETAEALDGAAMGYPADSGQRFIYKQQAAKARAAFPKATEAV